jgi:PadR family transcriptional regulator, regulatory protein PadR
LYLLYLEPLGIAALGISLEGKPMDFSKELIAATAEPLILSILRQRESYGYALIKEVQLLSRGKVVWTEGMLYPVLHRLEDQALIKSSWKTTESGRKRKYYQLANKGLKKLETKLEQWDLANSMLKLSRGNLDV